MALDQTKLQKVFEGVFRYTSDDDTTAANYFGLAAHMLKKGDVVIVQKTDGTVVGTTGLTAVSQRTVSALGSVTIAPFV